MEKTKKKTGTKTTAPKNARRKKTKKTSLLDAAIIGATTPTMGGLTDGK